jgi:hypothetical protein
MKIAITIGAYQLDDFVALNLAQLRAIFGPDVPILVSDDISIRSPVIERVAARYDADYTTSNSRRQHFAGDVQAFINSLAFARANSCDVALKISQRVILIDPAFLEVMRAPFAQGKQIALPGKPTAAMLRPGYRSYSWFKYLTDCVAIRSDYAPERLVADYRAQLADVKNRVDTFVERLIEDLADKQFPDTTHVWYELTNHMPRRPFRYLRKCQNDQRDYVELAHTHGLDGPYELGEWKRIDPQYRPVPTIV